MPLVRFSSTFDTPGLVFLPASEGTTSTGRAVFVYPDVSAGTAVAGNVQQLQGDAGISHEAPDGSERFCAKVTVCLLDDPSGLNGGLGVRRDDAFSWPSDGRLAVARGDCNKVGSVWRVLCETNQ